MAGRRPRERRKAPPSASRQIRYRPRTAYRAGAAVPDNSRVSRSFLMNWRDAVADSHLPARAKLVGHTLNTWMSGNGSCFPGQLEISRRSSLTENTVRLATRELEAAGLLVVKWSKGRGSHGYQAVIPADSPVSTTHGLRGSLESTPQSVRSNPAIRGSNPAGIAHESAESAESGAITGARRLRGAPMTCEECGLGGGRHEIGCELLAAAVA